MDLHIKSRSIPLVPVGLGLVLGCSGAPAAEPVTGDDPETLIVQGTELLEEGRTEAALAHFERADELTGGRSAEAALGLSLARLHLGAYETAAAEARRAVRLAQTDRQRVNAFYIAGKAHLSRAHELELRNAQPIQHQTWPANPPTGDPETFRVRGSRKVELERAVEAFQEALAVSEEEAGPVQRNLAESLFLLGRLDEAREALTPGLLAAFAEMPPDSDTGLVRCLAELEGEVRVFFPSDATDEEGSDAPDITPPQKLRSPPPQFPHRVRSNQGWALVRAVIDTDGRLICPRVLEATAPEFAEAVMETIPSWRFQPASSEGRPVSVYYNLTIHFRRE